MGLVSKSKEGREMAGEVRSERKGREIEELARGWGALLAREVFPDGVGLDVDLFTMEEVAVAAARSLVRGAVETMTGDQSETLEAEHPCPDCGQVCRLERRTRAIQVRGGAADLVEPVAHCSTCRRDFFPSACGVEDRRASVQPYAAAQDSVDGRHG
jgi:hypothetical protein